MKSITSKIVRSLNEAIDNSQFMDNELVVGVNAPKKVMQCEDCGTFYLADESTNESMCPECGSSDTKIYGDIKTKDESDDDLNVEDELTEEEEEDAKEDAELIVDEALRALDRNDYKRFNECYRPRVRINRRGKMEAIVECRGHIVAASKKMTSRQKSAYKLSEKFSLSTPAPTNSHKKVESIKRHRRSLVIRNESRAIKVQACRILERMGAKYNYSKFNESLNRFINERFKRISRKFEDIDEEEVEVKDSMDEMTPEEIGDQVATVIKDTGLDVVANNTDIDGDTATVSIRVQDSDDLEVKTSEIEDALKDVFDAPVEIVGPQVTEGDKSVVDMAVVINPDDSVNEEDEFDDIDDIDEEDEIDDIDNLDEEDEEDFNDLTEEEEEELTEEEEEELDKIRESIRRKVRRHKLSEATRLIRRKKRIIESVRRRHARRINESARRRRKTRRINESRGSRRRVGEKFVKGNGDTPLFALLSIASADNAPEFLAQDDSMVSGNEDNAEDLARVFVSEEAAKDYITSAGIEDKFTPVSISVIKNESDEFDDVDDLDEDDDLDDVDDLDEEDEEDELDRIKESYKKRRRRFRK